MINTQIKLGKELEFYLWELFETQLVSDYWYFQMRHTMFKSPYP